MRQKTQTRRTSRHSAFSESLNQPFIEHAYELRRRLYYIGISVVLWGGAAYAVQEHIVNILLKPAHGESFIYTTPGGGIDFLFKICIYSGLIFSLPVIVYNALRFIEPLITKASRQFILWGSAVSGLLAVIGIVFGYYIGLPAALHFLTHQFTTVQIKPLVTIQSYLQFVIVYMVGSAMLFQLPLMLIFINRITPLKPKRLLHYERWVILIAFVLSGLMNPTPNMISQLLIAGPFILMYQVGILLVAFINKHRKVYFLHQQDLAVQASRSAQLPVLRPVPFEPVAFTRPIIKSQVTQETSPIHKQAPQIKTAQIPTSNSPAAFTSERSRHTQPAVRSTLYLKQRQRPVYSDIRTARPIPTLRSIDRLPSSSV
jgi:sec-independent protein translocase protein TatC